MRESLIENSPSGQGLAGGLAPRKLPPAEGKLLRSPAQQVAFHSRVSAQTVGNSLKTPLRGRDLQGALPPANSPRRPRSGGLATAGRLGALAATAVATVSGCIPSELVLKDPVVNWQRLGIDRVAVEAVPPGAFAAGARSPSTRSPATPIATGDPALLSRESVRAAELLRFALMQSAFDVGKPGARTARLELAVTRVSLRQVARVSQDDAEPADSGPVTLGQNPQSTQVMGAPDSAQPGDIAVRAILEVQLVEAGQTRPIWSKVARGSVDYRPPQSLFSAEPEKLDARTEELLRGLAVRRALLQVVRKLLPRYTYQDVE